MSFIVLLLFLAIFIIILIPTFLLSVIRTIVSMLGFLFTGKRRRASSYRDDSDSYYRNNSGETKSRASSSVPHKKMFDKNEGEYVDFEEIKEDK